jgi:Baseplate J-like protein
MAAIIYLDVDDEITSAAARIRSAEERRVVLVVPGGSRLATSRINFRLLAREAQTRGRRLWIIAADGATRALAASAGLPVYGSVAEYEDSMEVPAPPAEHDGGVSDAAAAPRARRRRGTVTSDTEGPAEPETDDGSLGAVDLAAAALPLAAAEAEVAAAGAAAAPSGATPLDLGLAPVVAPRRIPPAREAAPPQDAARREIVRTRDIESPRRGEPAVGAGASIPVLGPRREWPIGRTTAVIAGLVLALVLAVGGVGAYVFLPSATIVVTAHPVAIGPVDLTVRADPAATAVDPGNDTVPAQQLTFQVEVTDTFETKGTRVEETRARGEVTFQNYDTSSSNTVADGSIVSTEGGIQFRLRTSVTVPIAQAFPTFKTGEATVAIDAVRNGTAGNVPANAITVVPPGESPALLRVNNARATTGGSHKEFPQIGQDEIDAAVASLRKQLGTKFNALLANPTGVPEGMTLFPETKALGKGTPSTDPKDLLDKEVDSFDLGMTATGTVTAVDQNAVEEFAASEITGDVAEGHRLVEDSVKVTIGEPAVEGAVVTFQATATAQQVRELDAKSLLAQVKGKAVPDARSILERFGDVDLSVWPGWVTSIPTIDARVSLTADTSSTPHEPSGSGSPGASASP